MTRTQFLRSKGSPSGEGYWDINKPLLNDAINPIMGVYFRGYGNTEEQKTNCPEGEFRKVFSEEVALTSLMKN